MEFLKIINQRTLIVYGAGQVLRSACLTLGAEFYERIQLIIDRTGGEGQFFIYNEIKVPTITLDSFIVLDPSNTTLLITPLTYYEIFDDLNANEKLDGIDCYIYPLIRELAEPHGLPQLSIAATQRIPNTIHYIWFGQSSMSDLNRRCIDSWSIHNPSFNIMRWDESNYDITTNEFMYDAYKARKWALAADYARLDILYKHGGIYLDTDIEMIKNLNILLHTEFFGFLQNTWMGIFVIGSVPNNPLLLKLMKPFHDNIFSQIDVLKYSKQIITESYNVKQLQQYGCSIWNDNHMIDGGNVIFPQDMVIVNTRLAQRTENTIAIHHYERTWSSELKSQEDRYTKFIEKHAKELNLNA